MAQMTWGQSALAWLLILTCCFLMLVIMIQRGRGGGLSGAFGGGGGSSAFGAKTGDVFTWITVVIAVFFLVLAVVANFAFDRSPEALAAPAEVVGTETDSDGAVGGATPAPAGEEAGDTTATPTPTGDAAGEAATPLPDADATPPIEDTKLPGGVIVDEPPAGAPAESGEAPVDAGVPVKTEGEESPAP